MSMPSSGSSSTGYRESCCPDDSMLSPLLIEGGNTENDASESYSNGGEVDYGEKAKFFRRMGALIGFGTQVLSLVAYRNLLLEWPQDNNTSPSGGLYINGEEEKEEERNNIAGDWFRYVGLQVASKIDLLLYAAIWIVVTMTLTRAGVKIVARCLGLNGRNRSDDDCNSTPSPSSEALAHARRMGNILGINLFVGIVVGNLVAWFVVDSWLGFPVPVGPILGIAIFDSALCWFLIWTFNSFLADPEDDEDCDEETINECSESSIGQGCYWC